MLLDSVHNAAVAASSLRVCFWWAIVATQPSSFQLRKGNFWTALGIRPHWPEKATNRNIGPHKLDGFNFCETRQTRERERSMTSIQPHKADSGAARTSPGTSQKTKRCASRERERVVLHLSSPKADSGAARTSPGRAQKRERERSITPFQP